MLENNFLTLSTIFKNQVHYFYYAFHLQPTANLVSLIYCHKKTYRRVRKPLTNYDSIELITDAHPTYTQTYNTRVRAHTGINIFKIIFPYFGLLPTLLYRERNLEGGYGKVATHPIGMLLFDILLYFTNII